MTDERRRDGLRTMYNVARTLCRVVTFSAPFLRNRYKDNEAILNAIALCESVCAILPVFEAELQPGGVNEDIPSNPLDIGGVDPFAPLPPDIDPN